MIKSAAKSLGQTRDIAVAFVYIPFEQGWLYNHSVLKNTGVKTKRICLHASNGGYLRQVRVYVLTVQVRVYVPTKFFIVLEGSTVPGFSCHLGGAYLGGVLQLLQQKWNGFAWVVAVKMSL